MHKRILLACLFPASVILSACKPTVEVPWTLSEVEPIASPTTSTTPSYRFYSSFYGTITYAGGCTSATTAAVTGVNQVTFNTLAVGTYSACTIKVTTSAGKVSAPLAVSPFIVNSAAQNMSEITPVTTPTNDNTPDYIFKSTVTGAISLTAGSCAFAATSATANVNKTLTFTTLADGTYSNCIIKVGTGSLAISPFTVDTVKPVLAQVTPVRAVSTVKTPSYIFSSTEAGTITYAGGCTSSTTAAVAGNTTVTFNSLAAGTYAACTITVKDAANNTSLVLAIPSFTIVKAEPLNDTGVILCGDYAYGGTLTHNNDVVCSSVVNGKEIANGLNDVPSGQDAAYGRDAGATTDSDGMAGFAYQKLGLNGSPLENQSGTYTAADAGSEATGTKWSCVKDITTNLVWEIKTDASTPNYRDKDHKYTWYNSSGVNTGNAAGTATTALTNCTGSTPTPTGCDTQKYAADVNSATLTPTALCGFRDWRLPTASELSSLRMLANSAPAIDTAFFPNTMATAVNYWTSSPDAASTANAWTVNASTGIQSVVAKSNTATHVRLVRGGF